MDRICPAVGQSAQAEIKKALTKSDFIRNEDIRIVQAPRSVLLVLTERSY